MFSRAVTALISSARLEPEISDSSLEPLEEPSPSSLARVTKGPGAGDREGPSQSVQGPPPPARSSSRYRQSS